MHPLHHVPPHATSSPLFWLLAHSLGTLLNQYIAQLPKSIQPHARDPRVCAARERKLMLGTVQVFPLLAKDGN